MSEGLPLGKLPPALLDRLLRTLPAADAVVGPRLGEDAAVLTPPQGYLVVTSDPITFTSAQIGRQVVQVNANDVAAMGAEPRWLLATVLLPPGTPEGDVEALMSGLARACTEAGVALVGGHTEVTDAVTRAVVLGTMLGQVEPGRLVTSAGARPGDALLLSKPIAVEGTAILADLARDVLRHHGVPSTMLEQARALAEDPGISVLSEARLLCQETGPHAMHDVTEGGLATALSELALASGVGLRVERRAIPVLPSCARVCAALGLDPLGLIGSGSLIAAVTPDDAVRALATWRAAGFAGAQIGLVTSGTAQELYEPDGSAAPLPIFARDELARWLEERETER